MLLQYAAELLLPVLRKAEREHGELKFAAPLHYVIQESHIQ